MFGGLFAIYPNIITTAFQVAHPRLTLLFCFACHRCVLCLQLKRLWSSWIAGLFEHALRTSRILDLLRPSSRIVSPDTRCAQDHVDRCWRQTRQLPVDVGFTRSQPHRDSSVLKHCRYRLDHHHPNQHRPRRNRQRMLAGELS